MGLSLPPVTARTLSATATATAAALVAVSAAACAPPGPAHFDATAAMEGSRYSAQEVAEASGERTVKPVFAVPKELPPYRLAFLNPAMSYPTFRTWSKGMRAAAKFYGVELDESDLNFSYDQAVNQYQRLAVKSPHVVGGNTLNRPTVHAVENDGSEVVLLDDSSSGAANIGIDDRAVGAQSVSLLADAYRKKMSGPWKGRKVAVVGLTSPNCQPCDTRVNAAFAEAASALDITKKQMFRLMPPGQDPTTSAQNTVADFLTAHPDDVVLFVSYGDEPVLGALKALRGAQRTADALAVASGGNEAARGALRDAANRDVLLGAIDFDPYAEGWNWVEAAIATALGRRFDPYRVNRVLTHANVDRYYPKDPS